MAFEKFKNILNGNETEEEIGNIDDEYYSDTKEEYQAQNGVAGSKMLLLEPRAYSESQQIADYLKGRNSVVVNLKRVTPDQAKRIVDFLSGTLYAIGGGLQKLGGGVFLCTPNNVNVEGKITDEKETTSTKTNKTKKVEEDDIDEFNW